MKHWVYVCIQMRVGRYGRGMEGKEVGRGGLKEREEEGWRVGI